MCEDGGTVMRKLLYLGCGMLAVVMALLLCACVTLSEEEAKNLEYTFQVAFTNHTDQEMERVDVYFTDDSQFDGLNKNYFAAVTLGEMGQEEKNMERDKEYSYSCNEKTLMAMEDPDAEFQVVFVSGRRVLARYSTTKSKIWGTTVRCQWQEKNIGQVTSTPMKP